MNVALGPTNVAGITASKMMGPCRLGPTSGVSQGAKEWSEIDLHDVLMCPRRHHGGDETSDIGDSNRRVGP